MFIIMHEIMHIMHIIPRINILVKTKLLMPNVTFKPIPFALVYLELSEFIQCINKISYSATNHRNLKNP